MNLPNYFFADLPAEASLSPMMILDACHALRRNRDRFLSERSTAQMVRLVARLAENWLEPDFPFRKHLLAESPNGTGFSRETMASGLDALFKSITIESLTGLIRQELGDDAAMDEFRGGETPGKRAIALGPGLMVHVTAGNIPTPGIVSLVHGLLLKSAQFVKCSSEHPLALRLFAHSLYDADPKLGACLELAAWKGGGHPCESPLFGEADVVTATGNDETVESIRRVVPSRTRFVSHGHKVSFAYLTKDALSGYKTRRWTEGAAADVAAWDQQGCLSPHVFYVQGGGETSAEQFAEMLAGQLTKLEQLQPRAPLTIQESAAIATRRSFYEVRASHSGDTKHWRSHESTAWTVVYENDPQFQFSCLNRFVYVKPVADLHDLLKHAELVRDKVSAVGIAALDDEARPLTRELARWGVSRVCRVGAMQSPPLTWRRDGRPVFADLLWWCDWESAS